MNYPSTRRFIMVNILSDIYLCSWIGIFFGGLFKLGQNLRRFAGVAKQAALFYNGGYLGWYKLFPVASSLFNQLQYVIGINIQVVFVVMPDILNFIIGNQVTVQIYQVGRQVKTQAIPDHAIAQGWVDE